MAIIALTDVESRADYFQHRILLNLQYWKDYIAVHSSDIGALDSERHGIIRAISFALALDSAWPAAYELIIAFSSHMERRGYWEPWNAVLSRAIEVAQRAGDTTADVNLSALSARLLQRRNCFKEAIACYLRTIRLSRHTRDDFNEARACTNLGYLYIEQGCWHRAEVLCCHALNIFEQIGSDHGRAHTENHLGLLYTRQRRWKAARQRLESACALWQARGDDHGLMRGFINLGVLYTEMERADEALIHLEKALHQARLSGEEAEIGGIYLNIGAAYRRKGKPAKAEAYARQAEAIFHRFSNLVGLALARGNLGGACLDQGKWQEACQYLKASRRACHDLGHKPGEIRALIDIVACELARGNQAEASGPLHELECLINCPPQDAQFRHLQPILIKYRRSLAKHFTQ